MRAVFHPRGEKRQGSRFTFSTVLDDHVELINQHGYRQWFMAAGKRPDGKLLLRGFNGAWYDPQTGKAFAPSRHKFHTLHPEPPVPQ